MTREFVLLHIENRVHWSEWFFWEALWFFWQFVSNCSNCMKKLQVLHYTFHCPKIIKRFYLWSYLFYWGFILENMKEVHMKQKCGKWLTRERPWAIFHCFRELFTAIIHCRISSSDLHPKATTLFGMTIWKQFKTRLLFSPYNKC